MDEATIAITVMSGLFGAIFLGFFIWGFVTGQFRNVEEASRRMIRNNVQNQNAFNNQKKNNMNYKSSQGGPKK